MFPNHYLYSWCSKYSLHFSCFSSIGKENIVTILYMSDSRQKTRKDLSPTVSSLIWKSWKQRMWFWKPKSSELWNYFLVKAQRLIIEKLFFLGSTHPQSGSQLCEKFKEWSLRYFYKNKPCDEVLGAAQVTERTVHKCQKLSKDVKSCQQLSTVVKSCQKLSKVVNSCQQ